MFKSLKRIVYYVDDLEKAKHWYNDILEKQPIFDSPFAVIYTLGSCSLSLSKAKNQLLESDERMDVFWEVEDIDSAYEKLLHHGAQIRTPITKVINIRIAKVIDPFGNVIGLTGELSKKDNQTVEREPSGTAMTVAFCRALASKKTREKLKGADYLAEIFLTDEAKKTLIDEASRKWAIQNVVTSSLYGYFISRTAFIDSVFIDACDSDIPQIVFLGAGYDTRSYRFQERIKNTMIYELDITPTQQRKIEILNMNKITIPKNLSFVPINFKNEEVYEVLEKAGYDKNKKTLFIWEGVTYYLTEEVVKNTLHFIRQNSADESAVCFDYMIEKLESVNSAEPFQFWITKENMEKMLSDYGFKITKHVDPSEMKKKYLTLEDGTIAENVLPYFCFITAVNKR